MPTPTPWYTAGAELLARSRAHWKGFALFMVTGGLVGGVTALLRAPVYRSAAAFRAQSRPDTLSGSVPMGAQTNAQLLGDLLTSDTVLRRVARGRFPEAGPLTVEQLRRAILVAVNLRTAVVRFTVDARTPQLAQALAESTLAALTAANAALRATRVEEEQALFADRAAQAREALRAAERAGQEVEVARQVYVQLRVAEELAAVQEARNAPVVAVIDSPQPPSRPDRPRRRSAVLVGLLIGAALALLRFALEGTPRS